MRGGADINAQIPDTIYQRSYFPVEMQQKRIRADRSAPIVISLRIFLGIPDRSGRLGKFRACTIARCYSRRKPRNLQRQRVDDSWHNAREFIPAPEEPIKRRFASKKKE